MSYLNELLEELQQLIAQAEASIHSATNTQILDELRVRFFGKKGIISQGILKKLGKLSAEERPLLGEKANAVKASLQTLIEKRMREFQTEEEKAYEESIQIDPTLPGARRTVGFEHLITKTQNEMEEVFLSLGYEIAEGPEIENVFYNFEALNTPSWHPARDDQDSFYIIPDQWLLRTQTSPVQIRTMEKKQPPIALISPGKVYRSDYDATHLPMFHQCEGLVVDKDISVGHLKGTLEYFIEKIFGEKKKIRLRPSFFPFTEPSFEVDVLWENKYGDSRWLEVLGCGMVDPNVFRSVGYDSEEWTGFAFGMGIERITMLKYRLTDIRDFIRGDIRFIRQES
jgi:phenylalanyl-tRNA synthetase alpha chain